jgi:hypothetical protein
MKNGDGAFIQAYNGQAVVDDTDQIVVVADVTSCASDVPSLSPMLDQAATNTGRAPQQGPGRRRILQRGSEGNLTAAAQRHAEGGTDTLIAVGRLKPGQTPPPASEQLDGDATARERMASRLRTETGRADYARRKAIVEPVFGQVSTRQDGKRLFLRGEDGARGESRLLLGCHNIHKLFQRLGSVTLLGPATG